MSPGEPSAPTQVLYKQRAEALSALRAILGSEAIQIVPDHPAKAAYLDENRGGCPTNFPELRPKIWGVSDLVYHIL
jgi:hypothetical protein